MDRTGYIGSSDIGPMLGLSPYTTPMQLWEEKMGMAEDEVDPDRERLMRRGKRAEAFIIETGQEEFGLTIINRNEVTHHPQYPFLRAEIDFVHVLDITQMYPVWGNGECKKIRFAGQDWGENGSSDIPVYYLSQVMFGLAIHPDRPQCNLLADFGDHTRMYIIPRDQELCDTLVQKAVEWWERYVVTKTPPPPVTKQDYAKAIKRFGGFSFEASKELKDCLNAIHGYREAIKSLDEQLCLYENRALEHIFTAAKALGGDITQSKITVLDGDGPPLATWNEIKRAGYRVKPTSYRTLRLNPGSYKTFHLAKEQQ